MLGEFKVRGFCVHKPELLEWPRRRDCGNDRACRRAIAAFRKAVPDRSRGHRTEQIERFGPVEFVCQGVEL